ncbi:hypothetical protein GQ42DRAFT_82519 [Ramicandelaber brevisporus]|nr:hypothetical protein GQ42DRAFT_82519 [Ramicandelaber brevisporus]
MNIAASIAIAFLQSGSMQSKCGCRDSSQCSFHYDATADPIYPVPQTWFWSGQICPIDCILRREQPEGCWEMRAGCVGDNHGTQMNRIGGRGGGLGREGAR